MIRNQLLLEKSFNEYFRKQTIDEQQRNRIDKSLKNSRYSKLSYSPKFDEFLSEKIRGKNAAPTSPPCSSLQINNYKTPKKDDLEQTMIKRLEKMVINNKENYENEIDALIDSPKSNASSPENHFLNLQRLSPDEQVYINEQDQFRKQQYQHAKRQIARKVTYKDNELLITLNALKEQQKASKVENSEYVAKRAQNKPRKERIEEIEAKLGEISSKLKQVKQKYENSGNGAMDIDKSLYADLVENIESIDSLALKRLDTAHFASVEEKFAAKERELADRVEAVQRKRRVKETETLRECARMLASVEQARGKDDALLMHLNTRVAKMIKDVSPQIKLSTELAELGQVKSSLEASLARLDVLKERLVAVTSSSSSSNENALKKMTHADMDQFVLDVSSSIAQCSIKQDEIVVRFKSLDAKIQTHVDNMIKAQKEKEAEEKKAREAAASAAAALEAEKQRQAAVAQKEREEKERQQQLEDEKRRQKEKEDDEARLKKERDERESKEKAAAAASVVKTVDTNNKMGVCAATLDEYNKNQLTLARLRFETEQALSANTLKMYKFDLQKAINFPLNSLLEDKDSEENRRNFSEKIKTLCRLLSGQSCTITSTLTVNPSKHPQAVDFCLVYLARKIVEKAEDTVASRPETAFQYAQLVGDVLKHVRHFDLILVAQFNEKCPYTVPYYKTRAPNQPDDKYFESLGYKIIDGKVEEDVHFYKRMTGILTLYFTLMQLSPAAATTNSATALPPSQHEFAYFNLKRAWRWLVEVVNMTPRANITAEMLTVFLRCCAHRLHEVYGRQFVKLAQLVAVDYFALVTSIPVDKQSDAAVGRLRGVLDEFAKTKRFPQWKKQ